MFFHLAFFHFFIELYLKYIFRQHEAHYIYINIDVWVIVSLVLPTHFNLVYLQFPKHVHYVWDLYGVSCVPRLVCATGVTITFEQY